MINKKLIIVLFINTLLKKSEQITIASCNNEYI